MIMMCIAAAAGGGGGGSGGRGVVSGGVGVIATVVCLSLLVQWFVKLNPTEQCSCSHA